MRALVLGGAGMLGGQVVVEGRRRGHSVLGLSRLQADVTDPDRLEWWVRTFRPQVLFNCAAYTAVDACEEHRDRAVAVNGVGAGNVARAAASLGAHLLHVSTDYVFDGTASEPYTEETPTGPRSVYGSSKLDGERQALAYDRAAAIRTSWLFGPGGPNFVATMLRLIAGGTDPLRVVEDQVGCPTYTRYLARGLWDLARVGADGGATGVVHYRNRDPVSWHGFASEIVRCWRPSVEVVPVSTDEFPRPAPRPAYSVLAVKRFESLVGRPVEPWMAGLQEYLDLVRERGEGR